MLKRFAYLSILVILLILVPSSPSAYVRNKASLVMSPVGSFLVKQNVRFTNFFRNIRQISSLRQDKQNLQQELISLQQKLAEQESLRRENDALRQELGVAGVSRNFKKVLAHVIIQGSDPLDRCFTVDAGSNQGVKAGQPAVSQGFLLGRVISVRDNSAVVRSILSKESRIQAWIAESREKGLLVGDGNTAFLSDINQGVTIKDRSVVETSGLGGSLPQGILIGQTDQIISKQSDLSQKFLIKLVQDPTGAESLFILLTDSQ